MESAGLKNLITRLLPTLRGVAGLDALRTPRELDLHERMAFVTTGELRGKLTEDGFDPGEDCRGLEKGLSGWAWQCHCLRVDDVLLWARG
jgi:hypothetical protein